MRLSRDLIRVHPRYTHGPPTPPSCPQQQERTEPEEVCMMGFILTARAPYTTKHLNPQQLNQKSAATKHRRQHSRSLFPSHRLQTPTLLSELFPPGPPSQPLSPLG